MKKIPFAFIAFMFIILHGFAQVPATFNYQAVVRTSSGELVSNKNVSFRISILINSESGTTVYSEKHTVQTNAYGLANLKIGGGTKLSGTFDPGNWGNATHFIKIEIDPEGGTSYTHIGTSQLLSVPYAFHAQTVEEDQVDDADADPGNEIQSLSLSGSQLSITKGNTVTLPTASESPWKNNGPTTIYYNSGRVGIGTSSPEYGIDYNNTLENAILNIKGINKHAYLFLDRGTSTGIAQTIYRTNGTNTFYTGINFNNNFRINTADKTFTGLEVASTGNVTISGGLTTGGNVTAGGNITADGELTIAGNVKRSDLGSANMLPFAYGEVSRDGVLISGTPNITKVTYLSTGRYSIEIKGLKEGYISFVNTAFEGGIDEPIFANTFAPTSLINLFVRVWKADNPINCRFSFIVYQ